MSKWRISAHSNTSATPTIRKKLIVGACVLAAWLGIWTALSALVGIELYLPSPLSVARALLGLLPQHSFYASILGSISRISIGYLIGCAVGILLGTLSYFVGAARAMLSPMMAALKAAPVASFVLLALLWLRPAGVPILISAIMVAPIVYGNVYSGLGAHSRPLREVAHIYGLTRRQCALHLYLPSVSPYLSAACTTSFGLAWKAGVAAEVLCLTRSSIGLGIYLSKAYLETPELFAWTAAVVLLSLLLEKAVKALAFLPGKALGGLRCAYARRAPAPSSAFDVTSLTESRRRETAARAADEPQSTAPCGVFGDTLSGAPCNVPCNAQSNTPSDILSGAPSGAITVSGLCKSFAGEAVITDFSMKLPHGSSAAIMGASGCGKTTLLRIIAGLESADSGELGGIEGGAIAAVFQEARLFDTLSATGNVALVHPKRSDIAAALLRELGFSDTDMQKKPSELSGGMQRRAAVARALCYCIRLSEEGTAPILLLDEAVRELDADTAELTRELIFKLADATDCTVISVTHDRSEAERYYGMTIRM